MNNIIINDNKQTIINSIAKHSGKMEGIPSISTSALENTFCSARRKNPASVCSKCYACKYMNLRKGLRDKCKRNHEFYTTTELKDCDIPKFNASMFRFEAFGEVQNELQLQNYFTIAENNPGTTFALWSKNFKLIADYIWKNSGYRPENLNIIASSREINESDAELIHDKYFDFFDGVFTVYTKEYAEKHNIKINCGSKKCIDCGKCYTRGLWDHNKAVEINELLK